MCKVQVTQDKEILIMSFKKGPRSCRSVERANIGRYQGRTAMCSNERNVAILCRSGGLPEVECLHTRCNKISQ